MAFDPCNHPLKIWESIGTTIPKMGVHLGVWGFIPLHSFALREHEMCLWASPLARNLASPCFGHEPKAKVTTLYLQWCMLTMLQPKWQMLHLSFTFVSCLLCLQFVNGAIMIFFISVVGHFEPSIKHTLVVWACLYFSIDGKHWIPSKFYWKEGHLQLRLHSNSDCMPRSIV